MYVTCSASGDERPLDKNGYGTSVAHALFVKPDDEGLAHIIRVIERHLTMVHERMDQDHRMDIRIYDDEGELLKEGIEANLVAGVRDF